MFIVVQVQSVVHPLCEVCHLTFNSAADIQNAISALCGCVTYSLLSFSERQY